jgi:hypothetical protein
VLAQPDEPFSLMNGQAGWICYAADVLCTTRSASFISGTTTAGSTATSSSSSSSSNNANAAAEEMPKTPLSSFTNDGYMGFPGFDI